MENCNFYNSSIISLKACYTKKNWKKWKKNEMKKNEKKWKKRNVGPTYNDIWTTNHICKFWGGQTITDNNMSCSIMSAPLWIWERDRHACVEHCWLTWPNKKNIAQHTREEKRYMLESLTVFKLRRVIVLFVSNRYLIEHA